MGTAAFSVSAEAEILLLLTGNADRLHAEGRAVQSCLDGPVQQVDGPSSCGHTQHVFTGELLPTLHLPALPPGRC